MRGGWGHYDPLTTDGKNSFDGTKASLSVQSAVVKCKLDRREERNCDNQEKWEQVSNKRETSRTRLQATGLISIDIATIIISPPSDPISEHTTTSHTLTKESVTPQAISLLHTEGARGVACAPAARPEVTSGTMCERPMFIPDLAEKVDAVPARKKCRSDRVNGCIAPALFLGNLNWNILLTLRMVRGLPRSRSRLGDRGAQSTQCRPLLGKSPNPQSQSCYKLFETFP
jgi:hypothetical protein